jgi:catechol 2,3-dioxygenase-like lactoylglutathione lyase family enzyme
MEPEPSARRRDPAITAPVSRFLAVADAERSLAFYRDVLGFEVRPPIEHHGVPAAAELVSGPARIQIGVADGARDSTFERHPRGQAILFFATDDVAAFRDAVIRRGGAPGELIKVNWIKMRMFEIRDPDGHVLWFGQSFAEPDRERDPARQLRQALPELPVTDVTAAVSYYTNVLGFGTDFADDEGAVLHRDDITILLIRRGARDTGIGSCYVYVNDVEALRAELVARGADVQGEPVSHPWGLRDFAVLDLEGNRIRFGQPFE